MKTASSNKDESPLVSGTVFRILLSLSIIHCMNDALQSVISASYPIIKGDLALSFGQIGIVTLVYQSSASVFQPLVGLFFDKRPSPWSLPIGMSFTLVGLLSLAFSSTFYWVLCSVFLVGIGSSTLHPEASRLTSLASGGKRGLAQSLFQVGGNFGSALGPLLVALLVAPYGRQNIGYFSILAFIAITVMMPVSHWYQKWLQLHAAKGKATINHTEAPLPLEKTVFSIAILLILIFSKYVYMASLSSYYTFYLIEKFGITVQHSQIYLFVFLCATAIGTMLGGPVGDKIGRKYVIWASILGAAPFALMMPHVGLLWTIILSFCTGLMLSSAFPAILVYAQELLPYKLGLVSGLFFGFAFGIGGIASAILGKMADIHGIEAVYNVCAYMPLLGLITCLLPNLKKVKGER
ncbi:FSR family fosmidomycin resistance protein-like MFS transporter [Parabacteroides sp. PF5-5]|uniref:MFS transporter n=1 Tax=unclassified Parabacteroides TaxID=2649774 RepID=UPI00247350BF|nr:MULTISPECIES: MFS transporter [unclassified Parabacteroides]MDH6305570.1 FSR family fosmidomycin resistance protein-like MFS transporter [Parabacteroides sp. PH5-39]MDH6316390.1 FSR family fosmidomycin resistance protein-like MFS transporter [Parabacteroides sp. PF5-13]MDH6319875.1 FSR family fosmidomycin resistance protein-like MFS transporter [Parabacteroides sp. PH5-13]MDH6323534.1 FSR family fosmidomycin resistance protein-like MFS transporter [Parabacteroides sp. PH5-8]MDH6327577.1 FSR